MKYVLEAIEVKAGEDSQIKLTVQRASGRKLVMLCSRITMTRVDEPTIDIVDVEVDYDGKTA